MQANNQNFATNLGRRRVYAPHSQGVEITNQQVPNISNIPAQSILQQTAPLQQAPIVAVQVPSHQQTHQRDVSQNPQGFSGMQ